MLSSAEHEDAALEYIDAVRDKIKESRKALRSGDLAGATWQVFLASNNLGEAHAHFWSQDPERRLMPREYLGALESLWDIKNEVADLIRQRV